MNGRVDQRTDKDLAVLHDEHILVPVERVGQQAVAVVHLSPVPH